MVHLIPPGGTTAGGPKIECADLGYIVFLFAAWLPGLAGAAGGGAGWLAVSEKLARLLKAIVVAAVLLGLAATAAAIVLQAATATGTSFWTALDADAVDAVSDTRPVRAWAARLGLWLLLGIVFRHASPAPRARSQAGGSRSGRDRAGTRGPPGRRRHSSAAWWSPLRSPRPSPAIPRPTRPAAC